jgi:ribonuclease E
MHSPTVQLKSGGYIVINQTEALVAIDVNSGRATRDRHIEDTALRTNLEAADEVARQLRLRDLAGLIVIDFIDMESNKHDGMVERRLKDALKQDRARIQVGRISHFGLLEMSRQRLRPSVVEHAYVACPHCLGRGLVRGVESSGLQVLRAIEEEGAKRRAAEIVVHVATPVMLWLLNRKRERLSQIEQKYAMSVLVQPDDTLMPPALRIERTRAQNPDAITDRPSALRMDYAPEAEEPFVEEAEEVEDVEARQAGGDGRGSRGGEGRGSDGRGSRGDGRSGRGRDGRGGRGNDSRGASPVEERVAAEDEAIGVAAPDEARTPRDGDAERGTEATADGQRRRRRRRRRGRRDDAGRASDGTPLAAGEEEGDEADDSEAETGEADAPETGAVDAAPAGDAPGIVTAEAATDAAPAAAPEMVVDTGEDEAAARRRRGRRGGRRRREEGEASADAAAPEAPPPVSRRAPTPADPFAGHMDDIFMAMEAAEEAAALAVTVRRQQAQAAAAAQAPVPAATEAAHAAPAEVLSPDAAAPITEPGEMSTTQAAPIDAVEVAPPAPAPTPAAAVASEPAAVEAVIAEATQAEPAPKTTESTPAPSEPVAAPPIAPIVLGVDADASLPRKRGWWHR